MTNAAARDAGRARYIAGIKACVDLGLIVSWPGWNLPSRSGSFGRIDRAKAEIAWMKKLDAELEELRASGDIQAQGLETNGEKFRRLTDKSMDYFETVLDEEIPFSVDYARLHAIKTAAASKVMGIGARVAIEMYKGMRFDALQRLLNRMREEKGANAVVVDNSLADDDLEDI